MLQEPAKLLKKNSSYFFATTFYQLKALHLHTGNVSVEWIPI